MNIQSRAGRTKNRSAVSQKRASQRSKLLVILRVVVVLELVAGVFTSPWLRVRHVRVLGFSQLNSTETELVRTAVRLPTGTNIIRSNSHVLEAAVNALPFVESSIVSRRLPSTVLISVTPRQAAYLVTSSAGVWQLDLHGIAIRSGPTTVPLPVIHGSDIPAPTLGRTVSGGGVPLCMSIIDRLPVGLRTRLAAVRIDKYNFLWLKLVTGCSVQFGSDADLEAKLRVLSRIFAQSPHADSELLRIIVSSPQSPLCIIRPGSQSS